MTERVEGSDLYRSMIRNVHADFSDLMRQVWTPTPWMADVYTDSPSRDGGDRMRRMRGWCRQRWGEESDPLRGRTGQWRAGDATIDGRTWWGFREREQLDEFVAAWPQEDSVDD